MKKITLALFTVLSLNVFAADAVKQGAILEATLNILPAKPGADENKNIQPGTPVIVAAVLRNIGTETNAPGVFYVRFLYPEPLNKQQGAVAFSTEKVDLPSIAPGGAASLVFKTPQATPSLFDFIRQDWSLRQYEAVAAINEKEYVLGNTRLTFSAYYYPGTPHESPVQVPSK